MLSSTDLVQAVTADLEKIRETAPLVLSLTNSVVQPLTANLLLAIGAVPAMLNDAEEAVDMLRSGTGALLVNLGTVTREQGAAMQTAVREANRLNIPWVLDPVAVGALSLRTRLAGQLKEQSPRIIRGNASEIMGPGRLFLRHERSGKHQLQRRRPACGQGTGPAHGGRPCSLRGVRIIPRTAAR